MSVGNEISQASAIDKLEFDLLQFPSATMPLVHIFTPGLYVRQIQIPAGTILTSMRHKTEHPFVILSGIIDVQSENENIRYQGPCIGVTHPGTKRVLYAQTDTIWLTFHANPEDVVDLDELGKRLIDPVENPLIEDKEDPKINLWRNSPAELLEYSQE